MFPDHLLHPDHVVPAAELITALVKLTALGVTHYHAVFLEDDIRILLSYMFYPLPEEEALKNREN